MGWNTGHSSPTRGSPHCKRNDLAGIISSTIVIPAPNNHHCGFQHRGTASTAPNPKISFLGYLEIHSSPALPGKCPWDWRKLFRDALSQCRGSLSSNPTLLYSTGSKLLLGQLPAHLRGLTFQLCSHSSCAPSRDSPGFQPMFDPSSEHPCQDSVLKQFSLISGSTQRGIFPGQSWFFGGTVSVATAVPPREG